MPVPDNPTWDEIRTGLTATGQAIRTARQAEAQARANLRSAQDDMNTAQQQGQAASNEMDEWLDAIRRKIVRAP